MEPTIFRFIWRYSSRQQIGLILLVAASYPFLFVSLDLPRLILDQGIRGRNIPEQVLGIPVDQVGYLMLLSGIYLVLVFVNGGFKFVINTFKGRVGERMLRRLRYRLYDRLLHFPLPHFRHLSQGELVAVITAEVESLGGFIGDAFAHPAYHGGILLVNIVYIFLQDPLIGTAAVALYPVQAYVIPRLQRKVNQLGKERVKAVRKIADRIGETAAGALAIRANNTAAWHQAEMASRFGDVFEIRFEIYQRKFFIKFLNNFINELTPFFFYALGGYLVIRGQLTEGSLLAVIAAHKNLTAPWKELLNYYQQREDVRQKYEQVVEHFDPPGVTESDDRDASDQTPVRHLSGALQLTNLAYGNEDLGRPLDGVTVALALDRHTALLDAGGGGRLELALLVARLLKPASGNLRIGEVDLADLPDRVIGRRISFVGAQAFMFAGTLRDNLTYGLRQATAAAAAPPRGRRAAWRAVEARAAGNSALDPSADWLDYGLAGVADQEGLERRIIAVLDAVGLTEDVFQFGLSACLAPDREPGAAQLVLEARRRMALRLALPANRGLIEPFDLTLFNHQASVAENLLFGTPADQTFAPETLAAHPYVLAVLEESGLTRRLTDLGLRLAGIVAELYASLPPGHEFYRRLSFIGPDDLPVLQRLAQRFDRNRRADLGAADRHQALTLALRFVPGRHRVGLWNRRLESDLLQARRRFNAGLPAKLRGSIAFFDPQACNPASSVLDNVVFGKPIGRIDEPGGDGADRLARMVGEVVREVGLGPTVLNLGLGISVGVQGGRLSLGQRQKLALAQALLKQPDLLVLHEALVGLDGATAERVLTGIRAWQSGRGLLCSIDDPAVAQTFDEVVIMAAGKLAEAGPVNSLDRPGSMLRKLCAVD